LELNPPKRFGQEVCKLIFGADVVRLHAPFLQTIPNKVVLHPDVLASLMEDRVLC
jgi:hypothetical protein